MAAVFVLIFVWMFIVISLKFIPSFFFVLIFISLIFIFIFVFVSVEISEMSSSRIAIVIVHDPISKSLRHGKGEIHLPHVGHHQNLIHGGIPRIDQQLEGIPFRRLDRTRFEGEFSSDIVLEVVQHHDIHVEIHFVQSPSPSSFVRILLLEQNQMQRPLQVHLPATATATAKDVSNAKGPIVQHAAHQPRPIGGPVSHVLDVRPAGFQIAEEVDV
mmetsp:Transcript_6999/g.14266  ORF Transcript_6999/g.14266 Transcript_6999/m.14266 type:complete len:215 (-) Transcript_6999:810-1454(-)